MIGNTDKNITEFDKHNSIKDDNKNRNNRIFEDSFYFDNNDVVKDDNGCRVSPLDDDYNYYKSRILSPLDDDYCKYYNE